MIGTKKECFEWLSNQPDKNNKGKELYFKIDRHRKTRSLNANSYAWVLIRKLATELRTSEEEMHLMMLERYGQSLVVPVEPGKFVDKEAFYGYCDHYRCLGYKPINDKPAIWYKLIKGSRHFDTKEMAVYIDGIVSECKEQDIEVEPEEVINEMKEKWQSKKEMNKDEATVTNKQ